MAIGNDNRTLRLLNPDFDPNLPASSSSKADSPFLDLMTMRPNALVEVSDNPFLGDSPETWDVVSINGHSFPGLCKVSGRIAIRKDRQRGAGKNGEKVVHLGYEPATIDITLRIWTREQWVAFREVAAIIRPRQLNGTKPQTFDLAHPALSVYGIRAVEFLEAGLPEPASEPHDCLEVKLKAIEYLPPTDANTGENKGAVPLGKAHRNKLVEQSNVTQASFEPPANTSAQPPSVTSSGPNASFSP